MSSRRKELRGCSKKRRRNHRNLWIMGLLAALGIVAGIWISPRRTGDSISVVKAPMPSLDSASSLKDSAWLEARLQILWEELGIPRESVVLLSGSGSPGFPIGLEVQLPKHRGLGAASKALEALGREAPAQVEIRWEREETAARLAVISLNGLVTHKILLLEQDSSKTLGLPEGPKVAVIMDDLGGDQRVFKLLLEMRIPITLAILPGGAQARKMAEEARASGLEVMVHLPMEPKDYPSRNPGPHALMVSMDNQKTAQLIASQLDQFPLAAGVNNHMGSKLTEDPHHMSILMDMLAKRSMYFVDSFTSPNSVAYSMARQKGLRAFRRDIFLDNSRSPDRIKEQFQALMSLTRKRGYGLAICHPYPETLALLPELYELSRSQGVNWVKVSQLPWKSLQDQASLASSRHP